MNPIELIKAKNQHIARLANQRGAEGETCALSTTANWIPRPKGKGLRVLLSALCQTGVVIKGSSFDAIALPDNESVDFTNSDAVRAMLPKMVFVEIKTANQLRVKPDFSGFYFAITDSEIAAAEALGSRHKVALYNRLNNQMLLTSIPEILSRSKSRSWQLSVQL